MAGKSDEAMRTIGEVADSLDLPQHVLRFWETRFKQIDPLKRAGGRRFYRQRDIELVAAIRHLLYQEGYTIKGVQRILKEQGVEAVLAGARQREARDGEGAGPEAASDAGAALRHAADQPGLIEDEETEDFSAESELDEVSEEEERDDAPDVELEPAAALPVVVEPRPLAEAEARVLREVLAEIEECKRLLKLTQR